MKIKLNLTTDLYVFVCIFTYYMRNSNNFKLKVVVEHLAERM